MEGLVNEKSSSGVICFQPSHLMESAERLAAEVCGDPNRGVRVPELLAEMRGGDNLQLGPVDVPREALENSSTTADHITGVRNRLLTEPGRSFIWLSVSLLLNQRSYGM